MNVKIHKEFDRNGRVISKECQVEVKRGVFKGCQHECTAVCYNCSVYIGDGSKKNLFKGVK